MLVFEYRLFVLFPCVCGLLLMSSESLDGRYREYRYRGLGVALDVRFDWEALEGWFRFTRYYGDLVSHVTEGEVWKVGDKVLGIRSYTQCSDQIFYKVRDCYTCQDSLIRIRVMHVGCRIGPDYEYPVEGWIESSCGLIHYRHCRDTVFAIVGGCSELKYTFRDRLVKREVTRVIRFGDGRSYGKEVIIVVDFSNMMFRYTYYVIQGLIPVDRKRIVLCVWDCMRERSECFVLWKYKY